MKRFLIPLSYLFLCHTLYSQIDSLPETFFPHHIGDVWEYETVDSIYKVTLTADSIQNGSHYLYYDYSDTPLYKIDSLFRVFQYPDTELYSYNLNAASGSSWIIQDTSDNVLARTVARVDSVYWETVLGVNTQIKVIGYYYQPVADTTDFSEWVSFTYLASGFGYFLTTDEVDPVSAESLIGCTISGKTYGTMTSIKEYLNRPPVPSLYKLYSAFPNPFNPSTTISYSLPVDNRVKITIYNILGIAIEEIVDEFQSAGFHSIRFESKNLSSGVYFVEMVAGKFVAVNKIIYSK